jgi:hypothetical protein
MIISRFLKKMDEPFDLPFVPSTGVRPEVLEGPNAAQDRPGVIEG